ncbi:MAG TPA: glycerol kinase GlpK [Thermoanaerobaculia bacterium]|nr:glycerol kinase GlpK [Thermoanaerobaculia bacterium]
MPRYVLALDQGTTSSRSILFDHAGAVKASAQKEFPQIYPSPGHVEHDPEAIWSTQLATARKVLRQAKAGRKDVAAIGITNQRETVVLWERATGRPVANAIVWQSRITAPVCDRLKADGLEPLFQKKTGLVVDAYFSGTKIKHLLDSHRGLRARARKGEILAGTIDCFLLWRLTGGRVHATDVSNASRTLLFDIHELDWDAELLEILDVPRAMLPEVKPSSGVLGETDPKLFGSAIPIAGVAGDQQAATFGQGCFKPGMAKNTYGTGCFLLMNTGSKAVASRNGLLTTVGWQIGDRVTYCLEGSVFIAGAAVQWLRDGLGLLRKSGDVEALAATVPDSGGVVFVPAFVGLGAPYWDPYARGTILGIERGTTRGHLARAVLEAMSFQTLDVVEAMERDSSVDLRELRVDGGAAVDDLLMQNQADVLGKRVRRPVVNETTALGAAYLAGLGTGFWKDQADVERNWALDREFQPRMKARDRQAAVARWRQAVERSRGWVAAT